MPLRDHFHTTSTRLRWESLHASWPQVIVERLNKILPEGYYALPRVHLGNTIEIDIAAYEREAGESIERGIAGRNGGDAPIWEPAKPTVVLDADLPEPSEYEVTIYSSDDSLLIAAIELVGRVHGAIPRGPH